jgi:hypothetical protein
MDGLSGCNLGPAAGATPGIPDHHLFLARDRVHRLPVEVEACGDELRRGMRDPFIQRDVGVLAASEHLQELQVRIPDALDVVAH